MRMSEKQPYHGKERNRKDEQHKGYEPSRAMCIAKLMISSKVKKIQTLTNFHCVLFVLWLVVFCWFVLFFVLCVLFVLIALFFLACRIIKLQFN